MKISEGAISGQRDSKCKDPEVGTDLSNSKGNFPGGDKAKANPGLGYKGFCWSWLDLWV